MLSIVYEDEHLIAINKPNGLLVHRSNIAADVSEFAIQKLRNQVGYKVFLIHRLDRPTSGILLFGKNAEAARLMSAVFADKKIQKTYLTIVRGYTDEKGEINIPLSKENEGPEQEAITHFTRLGITEQNIPVQPYPSARYSLLEVRPMTGRMHQIRRHMAKLRHYIIGDRTHGETHHSKMFREKLGCDKMLLHASRLQFIHPITKENTEIFAPLPDHFKKIVKRFDWQDLIA